MYVEIKDYETFLADLRKIILEKEENAKIIELRHKQIIIDKEQQQKEQEIISGTELAKRMNVTPQTVYRWALNGKIPFIRLDNESSRKYVYADVLKSATWRKALAE